MYLLYQKYYVGFCTLRWTEMEVKKSVAIALSMTTGLYTPMVCSVDTHSLPILDSKCPACSYPWCGGALTVSNMGAIGAGESMRPVPVLVLGGSIAIVALGHISKM